MGSQVREWHNNIKKCNEKLFKLLDSLGNARVESCISNNLSEVKRIEKEIDKVEKLKEDMLFKIDNTIGIEKYRKDYWKEE